MLGETEWRAHAELVGRVALAWNSNVAVLLRIFTFLTGVQSPLADTIFFAVKSDRQQRELINRVAEVTLVNDEDRKNLGILLERLGRLAARRNSAVHTVFGITLFDQRTSTWGPKIVPALDPPQDPKLDKNFRAQFERAERELVEVRKQLEDWLVFTPRVLREVEAQPEIDWSLYDGAERAEIDHRNL